jgi:TRAP-type C4-dicarboxylate transport system permease small subunit
MAWVPAASLAFSALAGVLLLLDLVRATTGALRDEELVMVQESEEAAQLRQVLADADAGKEIVR